jgi:hypothetical protein
VNLQHVTQQFQTDIADLLFRAAFERMFARMCQRPALVSVVAEKQDVTSAAKETSISNQIEENFAQTFQKHSLTIRCLRCAEWLLPHMPTAYVVAVVAENEKKDSMSAKNEQQLEQFSNIFSLQLSKNHSEFLFPDVCITTRDVKHVFNTFPSPLAAKQLPKVRVT